MYVLVQTVLQSKFPNIALGKHCNGDEAAVFGAAYYAAVLNKEKTVIPTIVTETPAQTTHNDAPAFTPTQLTTIQNQLATFEKKEEERQRAVEARSKLEAYLNEQRDSIDSNIKLSPDQKEQLLSFIQEKSYWLEESDSSTVAEAFQGQLKEVVDRVQSVLQTKPNKQIKEEL